MGRKRKIDNDLDGETMTIEVNGKQLNNDGLKKLLGDGVPKSSIEIKKAKIKDSLFLEVEYSEEVKDGINQVKKACTAPVHDDLKTAFAELDEFLTRLCYQRDSHGLYDIASTSCKGFTIGGNNESEGVVLVGTRELPNDKVLNLVSPFTRWSDDDAGVNTNVLAETIESCKHEVKLYLFEGKHQPEAQQELPFPDENIVEEGI